jgi:sRNA-binding regulator protein Hfq
MLKEFGDYGRRKYGMNKYVSNVSPVSTFLPDGGKSRAEICTRLYNYTVSKLLYKHLVGTFNKKVQMLFE